jgi:hypothetical protein
VKWYWAGTLGDKPAPPPTHTQRERERERERERAELPKSLWELWFLCLCLVHPELLMQDAPSADAPRPVIYLPLIGQSTERV